MTEMIGTQSQSNDGFGVFIIFISFGKLIGIGRWLFISNQINPITKEKNEIDFMLPNINIDVTELIQFEAAKVLEDKNGIKSTKCEKN